MWTGIGNYGWPAAVAPLALACSALRYVSATVFSPVLALSSAAPSSLSASCVVEDAWLYELTKKRPRSGRPIPGMQLYQAKEGTESFRFLYLAPSRFRLLEKFFRWSVAT